MSHVGQQEHNNVNGQWEGRSRNPPNCGNRARQAHMTRSYFHSQETYYRWRVWEWVWLLQRRVVTSAAYEVISLWFFLSSYSNPEVNAREVLLRSVCIHYYTVQFFIFFLFIYLFIFFKFQVATVTDRVIYQTPHIIRRLHSTDGSSNGPCFW